MKRMWVSILSGAYTGGVALGSIDQVVSNNILTVLLICLAMSIVGTLLFHLRWGIWVGWGVVSMGLGVFSVTRTIEYYQTLPERYQVSGRGILHGEVISGDFRTYTVVQPYTCEALVCPRDAIRIRVDRYGSWEDGAWVHFGPCDLGRPKRFDQAFDYPMYLAKEGIGYEADTCPIERMTDKEDSVRSWLHRTRLLVTTAIERRLPEPEAGLAQGLLLGGNDALPRSLAQDFQVVGLSHIVAVSGYNISVLSSIIFLIGIGLGWYRKQAVWIAIIGTISFVLLVGAPASAVRACLMALVGYGALLVSRPISVFSLLFLVIALMLFWNPLLLRYDIGFQLSCMATLAILMATRRLSGISVGPWYLRKIIEGVFVTGTVVLWVTPITVLQFGTVSPYALLSNVEALICLPFAFCFSGITVLIGWIPGFGAVSGWLAYGALHGLIEIAKTGAQLPGARVTYTGVQWWMVVIWYMALIFFFVHRKKWNEK